MIWGHFTEFSGRGNYPQATGTRPLAAGEAKATLAAERHPFFFQAVRAQIRGVARLWRATAEQLANDGLSMAILVTRLARLEGVLVDPLDCGGHRACLYHVLALRATRGCPLIRPSPPLVSPWRDGQKRGRSKQEILRRSSYSSVTVSIVR